MFLGCTCKQPKRGNFFEEKLKDPALNYRYVEVHLRLA